MARPQRNNVDYFPLYVENGRKMFYLESTYGNDGYATWLKILSELAKAEFHYINLQDKKTVMYMTALCRVSEDVLISIINDLVDFEEIDRELWKEKIVFSEKFLESIKDAYKKRSNDIIDKNGLIELLEGKGVLKPSKCNLKVSVNPKSKEEDSKGKKRKEKKTTYVDEFNKVKSEFSISSEMQEIIITWLKYKSEKGESYKPTGLKTFIKKLLKLSNNNTENASAIIDNSMCNNYKGIFELKNSDNGKTNNPNSFTNKSQRLEAGKQDLLNRIDENASAEN